MLSREIFFIFCLNLGRLSNCSKISDFKLSQGPPLESKIEFSLVGLNFAVSRKESEGGGGGGVPTVTCELFLFS